MSMRFPNGYGSVIKLSGRRRKPYAVRITTGFKLAGTADRPRAIQQYKYLEYFEKRSDAMKYLADFNAGNRVREHSAITSVPTVAEVYEMWMNERENSPTGISNSVRKACRSGFAKLQPLHDRRISNVRFSDCQPIVNQYSHMSASTVNTIITVLHGICNYALKWEYTTVDFASHLYGSGAGPSDIHKPFTPDEIRILWQHSDEFCAQFALITIFTGLRPSELLLMNPANVFPEKAYMIGGMKTKAGRDRFVPLHNDIIDIVSDFFALTRTRYRNLSNFSRGIWKPSMQRYGMDHKPDDGRHTCATLMESAGVPLLHRKLILGHAVRDITEGVYTHVDNSVLLASINTIPTYRNESD